MRRTRMAAGYGQSRQTRIIRVTPITRAVRLGLAASATIFALAGSGAALAQTCTPEAGDTVYCDGAFTEAVVYEDVHDLTVVLGANSPTSVTTKVEGVGVLLEGDGHLGIVSNADVTVSSRFSAGLGLGVLSDGVAKVKNSGDVAVDGHTWALGIGAQAVHCALAYNRGTIVADGAYSVGAIAATELGDAIVNNTAAGSVSVSSGSGHAFGLAGVSQDGDVEVRNAGSVVATGTSSVDTSGNIFGAHAVYGAFGHAATGGLRIINRGDIEVSNEYGQAVGIDATAAQGNVNVHNTATGSITARATGYGSEEVPPDAIGIRATSGARARVTNHGAISAVSSFGEAMGVAVSGDVAQVRNFGTIEAGGFGIPAAAGIAASADTHAKVENGGSIIVGIVDDPLSVGDGDGIQVVSQGRATVDNSGDIEVGALYATGIAATGALDVLVSNSGSIRSAGWEYSDGITAVSTQGDVTVENSGLVDLTGNVRAGRGIVAAADAGDVSIHNAETGVVHTFARVGEGIGMMATSVTGDVAIDNAGSVEVINGNYAHETYAIVGDSASGDVTVENSGELTVTNVNPYENWARGVLVNSDDGNVLVHNTGSIEVVASYSGVADGVRATSTPGDIEIRNDGAIAVGSTNSGDTPPFAFGIYAATAEGAAMATNAGSITASSEEGFAVGLHAEGAEAMVSNAATGTIHVTGNLDTRGIQVAGDIAMVDNAGVIEAASGGYASTLGVLATGQALASVDNTGRVEASGSYYGTIAIQADAAGPEAIARVSNTGDIIATSSSDYSAATGIAISADGVEVTNTGSVQAIARGAIGIDAEGDNLVIVNGGTIAANGIENQEYHGGSVSGILAGASSGGTIEITTLEGSSITADGQIYASGIIAGGGDLLRIDNAGDISVVDDFDPDSVDFFSFGGSYGIRGVYNAQADIDNSGDITVDVTVGPAMGIGAGGLSGSDIVNDGTIDVHSDGVRRSINDTSVYGIRTGSGQGDATVVNNGDIVASNGFGTTFGIHARTTVGNAAISNDGTIGVTGGDVLYYGESFGIHVQSPDGGIQVDNAGEIAVTAAGYSNYGGTDAIGIFADGAEVMVTNTGSITTYSHAGGTSVGVATQGDVLTVVNHGDILAATASDDPYNAIGVQMDATTSATFNNTGTITTTTANGVGSGVAVLIESDGAINFSNTGKLLGAVITRGGDDAVTGQAGSKWTLSRQTTDLGAGDDRIHNLFGSTLDLDSGRIVLGEGRNSFANHGLIRVRGDSVVDMGDARFGMALVNNGVIELGSSAADRLTVAGDLGGRGVIHLGRGNGAAGGQLVVDGSMRPDAVQTVDLDFNGWDALRRGDRTMFARVSGDSGEGSFVGGQVHGFAPGNFLRLGVDISSRIDAGNTSEDVFSASVEAQGLDDSGHLAASVGAGVQALLASQIGTWRQRTGVLPEPSPDRTVTAFVRGYGDRSRMQPNVGGGGGGFAQHSAGTELGMHLQPFAGFSMGLALGKSDGQQTLAGAGRGVNWTQAQTYGLYGTWVSPKGLYLDASAWQMDFASRLDSPGSRQHVRGEASAVNLEAGYTHTLSGGLRLEPQLQYTWTRADGLSLQSSQAEFHSEATSWRRARLGLLAWKPIFGSSGIVWMPYGSASLVRMDDAGTGYVVSDVFSGNTSIAGTSTLLELGVGAHKGRLSWNGGVNWIDGASYEDAFGGQLSLRYSW